MIRHAQYAALALVVAAATACGADAETLEGTARVVDGDGLRIGDATIRLFGIDAVEANQVCNRGGAVWSCGEESEGALADLVNGETVRCEVEDVDRYERKVSTCYLPDGTDINREQVANGWAVAYTDFSSRYVDSERAAEAADLGIWASEFVRPSDYRRQQREQSAPALSPTTAASEGCMIKANINSNGDRIYHAPGQRNYERTTIREENGERWFCSEADAIAAGWRKAPR